MRYVLGLTWLDLYCNKVGSKSYCGIESIRIKSATKIAIAGSQAISFSVKSFRFNLWRVWRKKRIIDGIQKWIGFKRELELKRLPQCKIHCTPVGAADNASPGVRHEAIRPYLHHNPYCNTSSGFVELVENSSKQTVPGKRKKSVDITSDRAFERNTMSLPSLPKLDVIKAIPIVLNLSGKDHKCMQTKYQNIHNLFMDLPLR